MTNPICLYLDQQVSATHAEVIVTDTGITVTDLRSATGTKVNGAPIAALTPLRPGDVIEIGASRFTFVR
jgi:pSer/pThr/pTyr-binding forkhead associated (FHA) protein